MYVSKNVSISFVALMGIFLLITLPSLAKIDPENITGMWLFDEGNGVVLQMHQEMGTTVKSTARSGLMASSVKPLNLMV